MSGSLDRPIGSSVKRNIKIFEVTGKTIAQIETDYNTNYGLKGWRIIQYFAEGTKRYVLAEKEL